MPIGLKLLLGHICTIIFVSIGVVLLESQVGKPQGAMVMFALVCLGLVCWPLVVLFSHMVILTVCDEPVRERARGLLRYLIPLPKPKDGWDDY